MKKINVSTFRFSLPRMVHYDMDDEVMVTKYGKPFFIAISGKRYRTLMMELNTLRERCAKLEAKDDKKEWDFNEVAMAPYDWGPHPQIGRVPTSFIDPPKTP